MKFQRHLFVHYVGKIFINNKYLIITNTYMLIFFWLQHELHDPNSRLRTYSAELYPETVCFSVNTSVEFYTDLSLWYKAKGKRRRAQV
jgi:hypothetical protein